MYLANNNGGAHVVQHIPQPALGDVIPGVPNVALLAGAGVAAYLLFGRKKKQRPTTRQRVARIRTIARSRR